MTNLLEHPKFGKIRVEKQGAEFLFCAKDVCDALGLLNVSMAISKLDDDEKGIKKVYTPGGYQEILFVTESGLYALVIRSNKPLARKFRKWITSEVLPSLRKYGVFSTNPKVMERVAEKAERAAVKELLAEVRGGLSETDVRLVAQKCRTDEYRVRDVLNGRREDAYMLAVLYARSTGNRLLRKDFYTLEGAERLLAALRGDAWSDV